MTVIWNPRRGWSFSFEAQELSQEKGAVIIGIGLSIRISKIEGYNYSYWSIFRPL